MVTIRHNRTTILWPYATTRRKKQYYVLVYKCVGLCVAAPVEDPEFTELIQNYSMVTARRNRTTTW
jgi:hypothetical protein